ncbi:MAG TPA: hypothetical protein VF680_14815 [Allosphingosinicella sp.]|jgi:hypothetical protein
MAVVQLNLSRRALLGAAFAAPVLRAVEGPVLAALPAALAGQEGQGPASPPALPSRAVALWDRAKARFGKADAELTALSGGPDDNLYNRAGTRHDRALVRLLRTRAPDAAALADKIDLLIAHQAWEFRAADACLAALCADARRLAATKELKTLR